jgi:hypothetical protein
MLRNYRIRSALVALAGITVLTTSACSDDTRSPVGPGVTSSAPSPNDAPMARRARGVAITGLQLNSEFVVVNGTATLYAVTFRNVGDDALEGLVIRGYLQAAGKREVVQGAAHPVACPIVGAPLPAGADCVMTGEIFSDPNMTLGPGTFTLKVEQQLANGNFKVLDSKTVDVRMVREVVIEN